VVAASAALAEADPVDLAEVEDPVDLVVLAADAAPAEMAETGSGAHPATSQRSGIALIADAGSGVEC